VLITRAYVAKYWYHGGQKHRSFYERYNFLIQNLIVVVFVLLEALDVTNIRVLGGCLKKFDPKNDNLMPR